LGLAVIVLAVGALGQGAQQQQQQAQAQETGRAASSPLSATEKKKISNLQRFFQKCKTNAATLTAAQKRQCSDAQAQLKTFQNLVAERTGQAPDAESDAEIEAELNVRLDPNLTLLKVTPKLLDAFLKSERSVNELVNCFESFRKCRHRAGTSLVSKYSSLLSMNIIQLALPS